MSVTLNLETAIVDRLNKQVEVVAQSEAAMQFGIEVTLSTVARIALLRGLEDMESGQATVAKVESRMEAKQAERKQPEAKKVEAKEAAEPERPGPDGWPIPQGWNRWSEGELVPGEHTDAHEYYTNAGWMRFYGTVGDEGKGRETIVFYWAKDPDVQELAPLNGVLIQKTPWGPGHMLPRDWTGRA